MNLDGPVLIAGAGIGGLTLARALRDAGFACEVFEREPEFRPVGAGLLVQTSGMLALRALGLDGAVTAAGRVVRVGWGRTDQGATLTRADLGLLEQEFGVPTVAIHRARLQAILLGAAAGIPLHQGLTLASYEEDDAGVTACFESGRRERGALLVAADGLRSAVRKQFAGDTPLRYAGYTSWRGLAETEDAVVPGEVAEMMGRGARFGFASIAPGEVYWFAVLNAPEGGHDEDPLAVVKEHFSAFAAPVPALLAATRSERVFRTDIHDRLPLRSWSSRRVTLLGDAAHPTTPNLGQGGCMALEDALVLAHCLKTETALPAALAAYERRRVKKTSAIVEASFRFGKLAQLQNPLGAWLRNAMLRLTPAGVVTKQLRQGAAFSVDGAEAG